MMKISFVPIIGECSRDRDRYLDYRRLCSYLYVYRSTANIVAALQQMYEKSIFSGFILSRLGKVDSEIRRRTHASKTPCNTTASHSA